MLSLVSYVCSGLGAGMWVIRRCIYVGMLFCLSSRSSVLAFGSSTINKEELVELWATSQDAMLERVV